MWPVAAAPTVEGMRNHITAPIAAVCLVVLILFTRGHASPPLPEPGGSPPISQDRADRLDRSGDDLYWTVTGRLGTGTPVTAVHRTHGEIIRREFSVSFGDLAGGRFVVVNDYLRGASWIERFDNGVTVAAGQPLIGLRDLLTDGAALYWADDAGLRSAPVGGFAVRTLTRASAIGVVALDGGRLYFTVGNEVRSVGRVRTEIIGRSTVTAVAVRDGHLYWSELGAGVRQRGGYLHSAVPGRVVTEVSVTGARVVWVDCTPAGDECRVSAYADGVTRSIATGSGTHDVQDDGTSIAYAGNGGVMMADLVNDGLQNGVRSLLLR